MKHTDRHISAYLQGRDLRSISRVSKLLPLIQTQPDFDALFAYLHAPDRLLVMRAADAVEKITLQHPEFLQPHKPALLQLLHTAQDKELKWHLALLIARVDLTPAELEQVWQQLTTWATAKAESKIVRVNALQALHELSQSSGENQPVLQAELRQMMQAVAQENIPSLKARIRKLTQGHS